ncbi:hypothetical protein GMDG_04502 [Pseudogymnoascus destructans 20631-21]|uniref:Peptidase S53 activation domain-containing protein n=1 Tax=Pseudogymnoascus destructans (strain ATCC MYA-4855 / 20631-21) TaxID=658429 RepID=L8GAM1_PSED2|nr:hypothetical protein GMDG_04502 [Pseudogymnoascus destructans 20631-21]
MRFLALSSTALSAALFCSGVAYSLPSTTKISHASAATPLNLRIGLKQLNLDQAEELVNAVSHPRSEKYGQYWTPQQFLEMFGPSSDAVSDTIAWLLKAGVPRKSIALSAGKNWIKVDTTVRLAEFLLDTTYSVYESAIELVACETYSVPADVRRHISTLYNIPEKGESVEGNSYGIVEYAPQSYNQEDLNGFFSVSGNIPNDTAPSSSALMAAIFPTKPGPEPAVRTQGTVSREVAYGSASRI